MVLEWAQKNADFKEFEIKGAKLLVGVVYEIEVLFLAENGGTAEPNETESSIL